MLLQRQKEKMGRQNVASSETLHLTVFHVSPCENFILQKSQLLFCRVTFCAEHARKNAMALQAQMRKASSGPSPEALLSQLSCHNRAETHGLDGGRSETSRILGKTPLLSLVYYRLIHCFGT